MKAIIIDDEPRAIDLIQGYLEHFTEIEVAGTFRNPLKAFEFLQAEKADLIFLDINMPHLSGISLARMIGRGPKIIFTTAHEKYAPESYDVEAVDYLLKPITLERFTRAMGKVLFAGIKENNSGVAVLLLKSGNNVFRINPQDILYLKKDGNYMVYSTRDRNVVVRESISDALEALPDNFIQVHKSYIVNVLNIDFYNKEEVSIQGKRVPVSDSFRAKFLQEMEKK